MNGFPARAPVIPACSQQESRKLRLTRISHREIRKTAIRPILLRHSGDSGSVTDATVCSLTTHLLFLVLLALSRLLHLHW